MLKAVKRYFRNQSGATTIEYVLIASLIAVFSVTALQTVGARVTNVFGGIGLPLK